MINPLENKINFSQVDQTGDKNGSNSAKVQIPKKSGMKKRVFLIGVPLFLLLSVVFLVLFGVLPALKLKKDAQNLITEGKAISGSIQAQDLNQAIEKIQLTNKEINQLAKDYRKLVWLKPLPFLGRYYKDGESLINSGRYLLEAADISVKALEPYADIIGIEGKEAEDSQATTASERLVLALDTLDKIQPHLEEIVQKLNLAKTEIDKINPQRYPEKIKEFAVREKVSQLVNTVDETVLFAGEIKPAIGFLKPLMGVPEKKTYLLLFQNDAELRPTGGFITAYALLTVDKGKLTPGASHDIYSLDAKFGNRLPAPEPIKDYLTGVNYWYLRDMNLSPDFKLSMDTFWGNAKKVIGTSQIDGIIAVDTEVLVDILKVLGPIGVADFGNFSAETDKRCDCPQVVYELERYADKPAGIIKEERKGIIGPLMHSILLNAMGSPKKKWPEFFNTTFTNISEKHILFYFFDSEIQKSIEALNAGGRVKEYGNDYFAFNDCNFGGAKSNMFISQEVSQEIEVADDGTVTKTVTIDYKNPSPASNCNLEKGDLCLNGLYRDWYRLYVPAGSQLLESKGSEVEVKTYEELGKTVFEGFFGDKSPLRPEGQTKVSFKYQLPFKAEKGKDYQMLIQKQPGTKNNQYFINLNGQEKSFSLTGDQELQFKIE